MVDQIPNNPYTDPEYLQEREANLGIIPKSNFFSAIKNNAGTFTSALMMAAVAAIVAGVLKVPLWGTVALAGSAIIAAGISAYAGYKDEKMSKEVGFRYSEARQIADSRVQGQELATALNDTLGNEIKDIKNDSAQTQQAVAEMQQKLASWQEREAVKNETSRTLH